eukprot:jgi/Ulvmu1/6430/UM003_0059.1
MHRLRCGYGARECAHAWTWPHACRHATPWRTASPHMSWPWRTPRVSTRPSAYGCPPSSVTRTAASMPRARYSVPRHMGWDAWLMQVLKEVPAKLRGCCLRTALLPSLHLPLRTWESHPDFLSVLEQRGPRNPHAPNLGWPQVDAEMDTSLRDTVVQTFVNFAARRGSLKVTLCMLRPQLGLAAVLQTVAAQVTSVSVTVVADAASSPQQPPSTSSGADILRTICRLPHLCHLRVQCTLTRHSTAQQDAAAAADTETAGKQATAGKQVALALAEGLPTATVLTDVVLRAVDAKGHTGRKLIAAVLRLPALRRLQLTGCDLGRGSMHALVHGLGACLRLEALECSLTAETLARIDHAAGQFVETGAQVWDLEKAEHPLRWTMSQLTALGVRAALDGAEQDLIQPYHMPMFMPHLAACESLTRLCVGPVCRDGSMHVAALGSAVGRLSQLQILTFEQLDTDMAGLHCVTDGVSRLQHLSHLSLWRCAVPLPGVYRLISATSSALRALRLVAIAPAAAAADSPPPPRLADVLLRLDSLALPFNRSAAWLAELLRGGNGPAGGPAGWQPLLRQMPALRVLSLAGSVGGRGGCCTGAELFAALPHLRHLTAVDLRQNRFGEADAVTLAGALRRLPALKQLDISGNRFRDGGVVAIASGIAAGAAASGTAGLRELRIAGCAFGRAGAAAIIEAACGLPRIRLLVLGLVPRCALRDEILGLLAVNPDVIVDCAGE